MDPREKQNLEHHIGYLEGHVRFLEDRLREIDKWAVRIDGSSDFPVQMIRQEVERGLDYG